MDSTPRLNLPYIAPQQAQKQVTYNEAMKTLDRLVQPVVKSRSIAAPPGSPAEGDSYLVAADATGGWAGKDGKIACYLDGGWSFSQPLDGFVLFVEDDGEVVLRQAGTWDVFGSLLSQLGINATPDPVNRLALASDAALFSHDGADHRLILNKAASGDTASLVYQTAFSGRAEFGLTGDDDFHVKVSPDGSAWYDGLVIDRTNGKLALPTGQLGFPATQNPSADPNTLDDYEEGIWTPAISFGGAAVGVTYGGSNGGRYTKVGRLCLATCLLQLTAKGSSTGPAKLGGLPFTSITSSVLACLSVGWASGVSGVSGTVIGTLDSNASVVTLYGASGGSSSALNNSNFTNAAQIMASIAYEVA